jgi:AhpD family alkylhydroperoxidase
MGVLNLIPEERDMTKRIDVRHASPAAAKAMVGLQAAVENSGLEYSLLKLMELRASQINGCAHCIEMHFKDAKAHGETDERLHLLNAWREAPFYSARERAALLWCETLTLIAERGAPDEVFEEVRKEFDEEELVNLTLAIVTINAWNRFAIGFRADVGNYEPGSVTKEIKAIRDTAGARA